MSENPLPNGRGFLFAVAVTASLSSTTAAFPEEKIRLIETILITNSSDF
jgi:hypothetical protein